MPVKTYVSRDREGRPWPADYKHEAAANIEIIKRLWLAFDNQEQLYAVVTNLHQPSADMIIISQRGLGVIELKHHPGPISQKPGQAWYAGSIRIKAGSDTQGFRNPHQQVQAYASELRDQLLDSPLREAPWLPGRAADRQQYKFGTAVCFTHPQAQIEGFRRDYQPPTKEWEYFDVLAPDMIPDWAASLRFQAFQGREASYQPYNLTSGQVERIATKRLGGTSWTEIAGLMPTGKPYGYLRLLEEGRVTQTFAVARDSVSIGRDPTACDIVVPTAYARVGRQHARITRRIDGIWIEDLNTKNGTFVGDVPVRKSTRLASGQQIGLGGPATGAAVCCVEFALAPNGAFEIGPTEVGSQAQS